MSTPISVGTRIREFRTMRGMTQGDLAAACEVSRSAVAQWETDRAGQLRGNITRIANALGVSIEHLLNGDQAAAGIRGDELAMIRLYRSCSSDDQAFLLRTARRLAIASAEASPRPSHHTIAPAVRTEPEGKHTSPEQASIGRSRS